MNDSNGDGIKYNFMEKLGAGETMWLDAGTLTGAVDLLHLTVVYTED
jgi:hypothetical protein